MDLFFNRSLILRKWKIISLWLYHTSASRYEDGAFVYKKLAFIAKEYSEFKIVQADTHMILGTGSRKCDEDEE